MTIYRSAGYHPIDRQVQPHKNIDICEEAGNYFLTLVSQFAKGTSYQLMHLYDKEAKKNGKARESIVNRICKTLDEKLEGVLNSMFQNPEDAHKKRTAIEILAIITLDNGVQYNISGDLWDAYTHLEPQVKELFNEYDNTEIYDALLELVLKGIVAQGEGNGGQYFLVGTSNIIDKKLNDSNNNLLLKKKIGHSVHHH